MITVRSAGIKGLGVFAVGTILRGTRIFTEHPLLGITHSQGPKHVFSAFKALPAGNRSKLTVLSASANKELGLMRWTHVLWYTLSKPTLPRHDDLRQHRHVLDIFRSNAFSLNEDSMYSQAIFPTIARLNHECVPNAQANFNDKLNAMNVHAIRDIEPEEEVTISYLDDAGELSASDRQDRLVSYGFKCACPICVAGDPYAIASVRRRQAIHDVMHSFQTSDAQAQRVPGKARELEALLQIINLMRAEGLVGRELSARCAVAARWYHELGNSKMAFEWASRGLAIDGYALGLDHDTYLENKVKVEHYRSMHQNSLDGGYSASDDDMVGAHA